jgi:hypothetical protein
MEDIPATSLLDKVELILSRHFGEEASFEPNALRVITRLIGNALAGGRLPVWSKITVDPATERFRDALLRLKKELSIQLENSEALLTAIRAVGDLVAVRHVEHSVLDLQRLAQAVEAIAEPPRRKPDPRSAWQPGARAFASLIEWGSQSQGRPRLSRKSILSPLVLSVQDLLKLVGITEEPATIVKALRRPNIPESKPVAVFLAEVASRGGGISPANLVRLGESHQRHIEEYQRQQQTIKKKS